MSLIFYEFVQFIEYQGFLTFNRFQSFRFHLLLPSDLAYFLFPCTSNFKPYFCTKFKEVNVCLIGSGNLATQLGIALYEKGHHITQVWSHTFENAASLAAKLNCNYTDDIKLINNESDIYIISVTDDAILKILSARNWRDHLVVHTAGSISMEIFVNQCLNYGVFYPFQTFTIGKKVIFDEIPICVEANTPQNLEILLNLGATLSHRVREINSEQRQQLHLAAVFACNFVNHFYLIGDNLLKDKGLSFDLLNPLIQETASKILEHSPEMMQTGPARRNNTSVIEKHLQLLENQPDLKILYKLISNRIIQTYK